MSMTTPIVDFVRSYAQSGTARLHMPGHKGQSLLGFEPLDITEICGADELYAPEGIIAESEANATRLFGTAHSYYSTEGSSQCIRAMLFLALQGAPQNGKRPVLLAARNAHKALLYAAALLDFDIRWLWPSAQAEGALCSCPVTAEALTGALHALAQQGIEPFGVYVTSPDYLGGVQDIPALAAVCRAQGVPLLVDNAHGAYLRFLPQNCHPIAQGAAMCCDSAHKTLPVVTGGAYLHLAHDAPVQDEAAVRGALALFGSTSPSYLILQSLDQCNAVLAGDYRARLAGCCAALEALRKALNETAAAHGAVLPLALPGNLPDREPLKLTLDAAALGCSGQALAEVLRQQEVQKRRGDTEPQMRTAAYIERQREQLEQIRTEQAAEHGDPIRAMFYRMGAELLGDEITATPAQTPASTQAHTPVRTCLRPAALRREATPSQRPGICSRHNRRQLQRPGAHRKNRNP